MKYFPLFFLLFFGSAHQVFAANAGSFSPSPDGSNPALGSTTDQPIASPTSTGSIAAILKALLLGQTANTSATNALATAITNSIPPGTNVIGKIASNTMPSYPTSITITAGGTFQQALPSNVSRNSLEIQNKNGTDNCWFYYGSNVNATTDLALILTPYSDALRANGVIPSDAIQVTCANTGDKIVVIQQ